MDTCLERFTLTEPLSLRRVHASLPTWSIGPECAKDVCVKANGDLLFRRVLVLAARTTQRLYCFRLATDACNSIVPSMERFGVMLY